MSPYHAYIIIGTSRLAVRNWILKNSNESLNFSAQQLLKSNWFCAAVFGIDNVKNDLNSIRNQEYVHVHKSNFQTLKEDSCSCPADIRKKQAKKYSHQREVAALRIDDVHDSSYFISVSLMLSWKQQDLQSSVPDFHPTPDGESLHRECGPGVHGERRHVHGHRHQAGQEDVAAEDEDLRRDGRGRLDPDTAGPRRHARHHRRYRETGATIPSSGTVSEQDCYGLLIIKAKHG